jgi:hypothetical protein
MPHESHQPESDPSAEFDVNPEGVNMAIEVAIDKFRQANDLKINGLAYPQKDVNYQVTHREAEAATIAEVVQMIATRHDGMSWTQYAREQAVGLHADDRPEA